MSSDFTYVECSGVCGSGAVGIGDFSFEEEELFPFRNAQFGKIVRNLKVKSFSKVSFPSAFKSVEIEGG